MHKVLSIMKKNTTQRLGCFFIKIPIFQFSGPLAWELARSAPREVIKERKAFIHLRDGQRADISALDVFTASDSPKRMKSASCFYAGIP